MQYQPKTTTDDCLKLAHELEAGQYRFAEFADRETAYKAMSRITARSRYAAKFKHRKYACQLFLAVSTPDNTAIIMRIERTV